MRRTVSNSSLRSLPDAFHPLDGKFAAELAVTGSVRRGCQATAASRPSQRMPFSLRMWASSLRWAVRT